jgi:hypothetical protein
MMHRLFLIVALVLIAGCGKRESELKPRTGSSLPVKPATALTQPTAADLLKLPPQAKPNRIDDPLTKSVERPDDPFHLPPPG